MGIESSDGKASGAQGGNPTQAAAGQSTQPTEQVGSHTRTNATAQATTVMDLMSEFSNGSALSAPGEEFVKALREQLEDPKNGLDVTTTQLSNPSGALAFTHGDHTAVIYFEESLTHLTHGRDPNQNIPIPLTATITEEAVSSAMRHIPGTQVLAPEMIELEDYSKASQRAATIIDKLKAATMPRITELKLSDFNENSFTFDINMANVNGFMRKHNPHAVPPRANIGFTLNMRRDRFDQQFGQQAQQFGVKRHDIPSIPILGVTAYVEVLEVNAGGMFGGGMMGGGKPRYQPVIHITDMVAAIPALTMSAIAIAAAAELFIHKFLWINQFDRIDKDSQNIGNLYKMPDGTNWEAASIEERNRFINENFEYPVLALDYVEGRSSLPGLHNFALNTPQSAETLRNLFSHFLNTQLPSEIAPASLFYTEYVGQIRNGSQVYDSREMDFLSCARNLSGNARIREFLYRSGNPEDRAKLIDELTGSDFKSLYVNYVSILDGSLINMMGQAIAGTIKIDNNTFGNYSGINMDFLTSQGNAYRQQSFTFGGGGGVGAMSGPAFGRQW